MPWTVKRDDRCSTSKPWGVVKDDDNELEGCHATEDDANDQLAALNAAEMNSDGDNVVSFDFPGVDVQFRVDRPKRMISGMVVPWGVAAFDSMRLGKWKFMRGSIELPHDVSRVKLLRDHDIHQPVGRAVGFEDRVDGLWGTFKIKRGPTGDEVLADAEDRVLDGFSIGPVFEGGNDWQSDPRDRSVRLVHHSKLAETTITAMPAFDDARVASVAAQRPGAGMADKDDKNDGQGQGDGGDGGGATVLTDQGAAMARFEKELDQRFEKIGEKLGESSEKLGESVSKAVGDALVAVFERLEDTDAPARAKNAAARIKVNSEPPVYRFDGDRKGFSLVRDYWTANTERDFDAIERLRKFQEQQRDLVQFLQRMPAFAQFAVDTSNASDVIPPGYRPDLFVNELRQGRPIVAQGSRGTITDATPFTVPRFVSSTGATADHVEAVNPTPGTLALDAVTVSPGAVSGTFQLTREIVDAANPAIDAIALAAMRESYNQQTEVKAQAELNGAAAAGNVENITGALLAGIAGEGIKAARQLLARYPFVRFAAPTGAVMSQSVTTHFAGAEGSDGRPLLPSVGAQNTTGLGNAVDQGWFVDGLPFVPAWAMTEGATDDVAIITNRQDWWVWESSLLTFRFEEKSGPALIELALFSYFATKVLRPAGVFALRKTA